jgi:hypothetical protein
MNFILNLKKELSITQSNLLTTDDCKTEYIYREKNAIFF